MKNLTILTLFILSILFNSCGEKNHSENKEVISSTNKIELIDFYGTHRCVTCEAIEANAKYTIDTYFKDEQEKGIVEFKTIYVDDEKNYDMAEKYEATGTALFINVILDGKENHIDLTDFAFSKGRDQEEFSNELKIKIENELSKL